MEQINMFQSNQTFIACQMIRQLLKNDFVNRYSEEETYDFIAQLGTMLGFTSIMVAISGIKYQTDSPFLIGIIVCMQETENVYKTYDEVFASCSLMLRSFKKISKDTFQGSNERLMNDIDAVFNRMTDRTEYEERKKIKGIAASKPKEPKESAE